MGNEMDFSAKVLFGQIEVLLKCVMQIIRKGYDFPLCVLFYGTVFTFHD